MSSTAELPQDRPAINRVPSQRKRRTKVATKPQLLTRDCLDGRTNAAKAFDSIASAIASDLGGESQLSTVQRHLIEAFAGIAVTVADMNTRKALGQDINLLQQATAISTMVRLASRLGTGKVARPVESLANYLASRREALPAPESETEPEETAEAAE